MIIPEKTFTGFLFMAAANMLQLPLAREKLVFSR